MLLSPAGELTSLSAADRRHGLFLEGQGSVSTGSAGVSLSAGAAALCITCCPAGCTTRGVTQMFEPHVYLEDVVAATSDSCTESCGHCSVLITLEVQMST